MITVIVTVKGYQVTYYPIYYTSHIESAHKIKTYNVVQIFYTIKKKHKQSGSIFCPPHHVEQALNPYHTVTILSYNSVQFQ